MLSSRRRWPLPCARTSLSAAHLPPPSISASGDCVLSVEDEVSTHSTESLPFHVPWLSSWSCEEAHYSASLHCHKYSRMAASDSQSGIMSPSPQATLESTNIVHNIDDVRQSKQWNHRKQAQAIMTCSHYQCSEFIKLLTTNCAELHSSLLSSKYIRICTCMYESDRSIRLGRWEVMIRPECGVCLDIIWWNHNH